MSQHGPLKFSAAALLTGALLVLPGCGDASETATSNDADPSAASTTSNASSAVAPNALAASGTSAGVDPVAVARGAVDDPETRDRFYEQAQRSLDAAKAAAEGEKPRVKAAAPTLGASLGGGGAAAKPAPALGTSGSAPAKPAPAKPSINMTGGQASDLAAAASDAGENAAAAAAAAVKPAPGPLVANLGTKPESASDAGPAVASDRPVAETLAERRARLDREAAEAKRAAKLGGDEEARVARAKQQEADLASGRKVQASSAPSATITGALAKGVVLQPTTLEFGDIPLGSSKSGTVKVFNNTDRDYTLIECRASCGCTTTECPKGSVIKPGSFAEVEIELEGGEQPKRLSKTVTFLISDGHPPLRLALEAEAVAYVRADPERLDRGENPEGRIVLTAQDGEPFRVLSMYPAILTPEELPQEASSEIVLNVDWDRLYESGSRQRRLLLRLDHPKANRVLVPLSVNVLRDMRERANALTAQGVTEGAAPGGPTPGRVTQDLNRLLSTGKTDEVLALIAEGKIEVNEADAAGHTPIIKAARYGDVEVIAALVDLGANLEAKDGMGRTPISYAAQSGNLDAVLTLIDSGANVKHQDQTGNTPIGWAAGFGTLGMVEAIAEAGAPVNAGTGTLIGFTPLIWASSVGDDARKVQFLLEKKADPEARDTMEQASVIHHAIRTNKFEHVKLLVEAGADVKAVDGKGNSILHTAAKNPAPDRKLMDYLLTLGVEVNQVNGAGETPLDVTARRKDTRAPAVIEALRAAGGVKNTVQPGG